MRYRIGMARLWKVFDTRARAARVGRVAKVLIRDTFKIISRMSSTGRGTAMEGM